MRRYIWTGCTQVKLRNDIMIHATELIRQIIRKQGLHTIYPGQDDSSFNDLLQTAWIQIERTLYKFRARPHCRACFNPDRPNDSALYTPAQFEYGIITYDSLRKLGVRTCPRCQVELKGEPIVQAKQDTYGGSTTVLFRGNSKVFNMWCVAPGTLVPTCHGPLPVADILAHFEAGLPIHVQGLDGLAAVEAMKVRDTTDTLVLSTALGIRLECSPEHRLYAISNGQVDWPEAARLQVGDLVAVQYAQGLFSDHDSLADIILTRRGDWAPPPVVTDELANLIGLFIAEGSYSYGKLVIYNVDDDVIDRLVDNGLGLNFIHEPAFQRISLCNVRFIEFLQCLGFPAHTSATTKAIPERLLCWSRPRLRALLSGLFDGDGHSSRLNGAIGYTTTSEVLQTQLRMILLNFGILTKISYDSRPTRSFGAYDSDLAGAWQILLSTTASRLFYDTIGFGIKRKQAKAGALPPGRIMFYGLNDKFRSLYAKYGTGAGRYDNMRRLLKASTCTLDVAKYALGIWYAYADDADYKFITARVSEHEAERDKIAWLPIKSIGRGRSELIDLAVDAPTHSYVANGLVVHNSQISRTVILAHIKKEGRDRKNAPSYRDHVTRKLKHIAPEDGHVDQAGTVPEVPSADLEAEIRQSLGAHKDLLNPAATQLSDMMVRFLTEARGICKFNKEHLLILDTLEHLLKVDDKPAEGIIGKLVEHSGLSRIAVTQFMKTVRLRSFEFTDSPIARAESTYRFDKRRIYGGGSAQDDDDE